MENFDEFRTLISNDEYAKIISEHLNKKNPGIIMPSTFNQESVDSLSSFIANVSLDISLILLETYHSWLQAKQQTLD